MRRQTTAQNILTNPIASATATSTFRALASRAAPDRPFHEMVYLALTARDVLSKHDNLLGQYKLARCACDMLHLKLVVNRDYHYDEEYEGICEAIEGALDSDTVNVIVSDPKFRVAHLSAQHRQRLAKRGELSRSDGLTHVPPEAKN